MGSTCSCGCITIRLGALTAGEPFLLAAAPPAVRFYCQTCPYVQAISSRREQRLPLARKKVDDVLGGDEAWANVDSTEARCPACAHNRAYFIQIQIRSADEPMTVFYKCEKCARAWSSN
jgi:DNA-directed RNA polymerase III subunit RPC11